MRGQEIRTVFAGVLAAGMLTFVVLHASGSGLRGMVSGTVAAPVAPDDLPIPGAVAEPNIAAAEQALGWHILRPNLCLANDSLIQAIYVNTASNQAAVEYSPVYPSTNCFSGLTPGQVELLEERQNPGLAPNTNLGGPDPAVLAQLQAQAAEEGPVASVTVVDGVPAIAMQGDYPGDCMAPPAPGEDGCVPGQSNPAAVSFQLQGVNVDIYGEPTWTTATMVQIGNTIS